MAEQYIAYDGPIVTIDDARTLGQKRYFTGKPCKHGHISERKVLRSACIACNSDFARRSRLADIEKSRSNDRIRRAEKSQDIKGYKKKYNDANKPRIAATARIWYLNNTKAASQSRATYAKANPEIRRAIGQNRRSRIIGAEGSHTAAEILALLRRQKYKCADCRSCLKASYEADHIMPVAKGGCNYISNIQLLCMPCNRRKGAKHPIDWAQENGRLL